MDRAAVYLYHYWTIQFTTTGLSNTKLVIMGSRRFCIARFFKTMSMDGDGILIDRSVVFTGVELTSIGHYGNANGKAKVKL
uniref:Uncharacterized protein n=1 Tax=Leersia perrieri TaxID=77586 RepID=A0A0D9VNE5_9ORYZ